MARKVFAAHTKENEQEERHGLHLANDRALCGKLGCDFQEERAYVFARSNRDRLARETEALEELGLRVTLQCETPLPFPVDRALENARNFRGCTWRTGTTACPFGGLETCFCWVVARWAAQDCITPDGGA